MLADLTWPAARRPPARCGAVAWRPAQAAGNCAVTG